MVEDFDPVELQVNGDGAPTKNSEQWIMFYYTISSGIWALPQFSRWILADSSTYRRRAAVQQADCLLRLPAQFGSGPDPKKTKKKRDPLQQTEHDKAKDLRGFFIIGHTVGQL